jgi:lipopolysaccharide export system permease protein
MIRILPAYIVRQHIGPFVFGLVIITFVLIMDLIVDYLDLFLGKGVPLLTVLEVFFLSLGWMLALSIPMAVLVATLMAYGRLSQDHEITAMRAGGVSFVQIIAPIFVISALLGGGLLAYNDQVLPRANHRLANLLLDIHRKKPAIAIREGRFVNIQGYSIHVRSLDERTSKMEDVIINKKSPEGTEYETISAKRGRMETTANGNTLTLFLEDGEIHRVDEKDPRRYSRVRFQRHQINLRGIGSELRRSDRKQKGDREMSIAEMRGRIAVLDKELAQTRTACETESLTRARNLVGLVAERRRGAAIQNLTALAASAGRWQNQRGIKNRERARFEVEIQKKLAIPCACFIFILIGSPLGIRVGRGGIGAGAGLSLGFFLLYYLCLVGGEEMADRGFVSPFLAMWAANILFTGVGIWLTASLARQGTRVRA